jgi:DNA mismatch repair protein MutS2
LQQPFPLQLPGEDLAHLAGVAAELDELRDYFCRARAVCPTWGGAAADLATFVTLRGEIDRALGRDGQLLDTATPLLGRLRRQALVQERAVRDTVGEAMAEARRQGWVTGDEVTLRGDRFCLPLRSGARRRIEGIVHARSATGNTLFVEPAPVVRLHNELAEIRLEAAAEERRILRELNRAVETAASALLISCQFLLLVDTVRAALLWSSAYRGRRPRLAAGGRLRICHGYHPLLLEFGPGVWLERSATPTAVDHADRPPGAGPNERPPTEPGQPRPEVVPLDLDLSPDLRVVLLSGPNAGGKSVALKTVGVFVLLAQCGWDVPAREDTELPLVQKLFVDLGDEQSIEMSLSSFSAHLGHLVNFLAQADADTLVLCDEIGSGTDPQEGTALAFTVLEGLAERGSTILASTHYGLLKAAVHDHEAMINAAMDYDEDTLRPLFTLRLGAPGASRAFDIAARWGFPASLLQRAREMVGEARFQIERLLTELNSRARSLAAAEAEVQEHAARQQLHQQELAERLKQIDQERERIRQETRREGQQLLDEGRRLLEQTVREVRSSGGGKVVIRRAKDALADLARRLPPGPRRARGKVSLRPGQRIHVPHLGLDGQILEVRGDKVVADADGLRLTLTTAALTVVDENDSQEGTSLGGTGVREGDFASRRGSWRWRDGPPAVRHEIDLRGLRGEEAWQQLDLLIDRAIPAGLAEILVIHGIGTGRLRAYLHEQLAADSRVSSWETASRGRGGFGATVVHLAG